MLTAVQLALREVIGAYAIAVLDKDNPDEIIAARKSSPLVVGIGEDEFFLASDATPIVEYTDKVVYLEDEEIAVIRRGEKLKVVNLKNVECPHEVKTVALNLGQLEKGGYPHFVRYFLACGAYRKASDRKSMPHSGGSGVCFGIPLP